MARSTAPPGRSFSPNAAHSRGCETGDAKITKGYRLPARHVIHAVGPVWHGGRPRRGRGAGVLLRRAIELVPDQDLAPLPFPRFPPGSIAFPPIARRGSRSAATAAALAAAPASTGVIFCCFSAEAPPCMPRRWPRWAALVPIEPAAKLRGDNPGGGMYSRHAIAVVAVWSIADNRGGAIGVGRRHLRYSRRARISIRKNLSKIGDFFRNEVANGKIPGAILLIQQHGKPVYHEFFGVQRCRDQEADDRRYDLPAVFDDQGRSPAWPR